jgi:hypothetical protein
MTSSNQYWATIDNDTNQMLLARSSQESAERTAKAFSFGGKSYRVSLVTIGDDLCHRW